jgi:cold shock CspA family protein
MQFYRLTAYRQNLILRSSNSSGLKQVLQARSISSGLENSKYTGIVKFFDKKRGFGMIINDSDKKDYFFHRSHIRGFQPVGAARNIYVDNGTKVEFQLIADPKDPMKNICVGITGIDGTVLGAWKPQSFERM